MAIIGIAACRKLEDYKQAVLHVGGEVRILDSSMKVDAALQGVREECARLIGAGKKVIVQ